MIDPNNKERYLYSVNPRKIIKGLVDTEVPYINKRKSLYLTLDDVKTCLKNATVYRRFANEDRIERVNTRNCERLHNAKFIPEDEWNKEQDKPVTIINSAKGAVDNRGTVMEPQTNSEKIVVDSVPDASTTKDASSDIEDETIVETQTVEVGETSPESSEVNDEKSSGDIKEEDLVESSEVESNDNLDEQVIPEPVFAADSKPVTIDAREGNSQNNQYHGKKKNKNKYQSNNNGSNK